ncbi:MAG: iron-containing redox enzyme family protein [Planctomycetota bacterium]
MTEPSRALQVTACANQVLEERKIFQNPYFEALQKGALTLDDFRKTQEQFYFAVSFFPRPMAALVARIPDPKARLDILHNLLEEHGEFHPEAFHETTFRKFLKRIGSQVENFDQLALWPEVRAFNSILTASCVLDELEVGISCMGIIEYSFSRISALIGKGLLQRGWLKKSDLSHYTVHENIDTRHAEEFFVVVEPLWNRPERRYFIEQGLKLGAYAFNRLYEDLYSAIQKK